MLVDGTCTGCGSPPPLSDAKLCGRCEYIHGLEDALHDAVDELYAAWDDLAHAIGRTLESQHPPERPAYRWFELDRQRPMPDIGAARARVTFAEARARAELGNAIARVGDR